MTFKLGVLPAAFALAMFLAPAHAADSDACEAKAAEQTLAGAEKDSFIAQCRAKATDTNGFMTPGETNRNLLGVNPVGTSQPVDDVRGR